MDSTVVWGFGTLALLTVLAAIVIWQGFATWRARTAVANEKGYRALAERAVATEQATEQQLRELGAHVADVAARLAALEKMLKEIE